jgi:hypothetical protein
MEPGGGSGLQPHLQSLRAGSLVLVHGRFSIDPYQDVVWNVGSYGGNGL